MYLVRLLCILYWQKVSISFIYPITHSGGIFVFIEASHNTVTWDTPALTVAFDVGSQVSGDRLFVWIGWEKVGFNAKSCSLITLGN